MSFNLVATLTAIAGLILGVGWMFAGTSLFRRWGMDSHTDGLLIGRRLAAVYLGVALILFLGRDAPPSDLRVAVCAGMLFVMVVLATLGVYEFRARRASSFILASSALEVFLAVGYGWVLLQA